MSDVILKDNGSVTVVGNLGVGTDAPASTLHVQGSHILNTGTGAGYAFTDRGDTAKTWVWYATGGSARLWSNATGDRMTVLPNGAVGIGTGEPKRPLQVDSGEIHSGGAGGGLSFADRGQGGGAFVEVPAHGERWVWYANGGTARLWSNGERLLVEADGSVKARSFEAAGPKADSASLNLGRTTLDYRGLTVQNKNPDKLPTDASVNLKKIEITPTEILIYTGVVIDNKTKTSNQTRAGSHGGVNVSAAASIEERPTISSLSNKLGAPNLSDVAASAPGLMVDARFESPLNLVAEVRALREEVTALQAAVKDLQAAKVG